MPSPRLAALLALVFTLGVALPARAQQPPDPSAHRIALYPSYQAFSDSLQALATRPAGAARDSVLDAFWQRLRNAHQVPYAHGDSVAFLYRGSVSRVEWRGDFNGWSANAALTGRRLGDTDLWLAETTFPADARIDYKVVRNGNDWILDPGNPLQIWSGFGPNSELRMPAYQYPHDTIRRPGITRGTLSGNLRHGSAAMGYDVHYRVYTPAGYDTLGALPVLYVTDGHEYAADHMGSLVAVLDNLIAEGRIEPVLAVFIDPREVGRSSNNRRQNQYVANDAFVAFVADELVPAVDAAYATRTTAADRAILGTSLGGLNSAYFGARRPDVFGKIAIQSPAFWIHEAIYTPYENGAGDGLEIFLTVGTIRDGDGGGRLHAILEGRGTDHFYREVNEGHSWGNWRALMDDLLEYFWATPGSVGLETVPRRGPAPTLEVAPNPFGATAALHLDVPTAQRASLHVYDALGRRIATLLDDAYLAAGRHTLALDAAAWPSGSYVGHLLLEHGSAATGRLLHLR